MRLARFAHQLGPGALRGRRSLWTLGTIIAVLCAGAIVSTVVAPTSQARRAERVTATTRLGYVRKVHLAGATTPTSPGAVLTLRLRLGATHTKAGVTLRVTFRLRHHRRNRELAIGSVTLRFPAGHAAATRVVRLGVGRRTPLASYTIIVCSRRRRAHACATLGSVKIAVAQSALPGGGAGGNVGGGAGGGGSGGGPVCSPSPCQAGSLQSFNVTVDDGGGEMVSRSFGVERPTNLVNSASDPVPVVMTFYNNQNWVAESAAGKYVVVYVGPVHTINGTCCQYAGPAITPSPSTIGAQNCGPSQNVTCDDVPEVLGVLKAIECNGSPPCENVDPQRIYASGGSKGGTMTEDVMCDPRTSRLVRAYSVISNLLISPSTSNDQSVFPRCAALLGSNPNTNVSALWIYGTADPNFHGPDCAYTNDCLGKGYTDGSNRWQFGDEQLASTVFGVHPLGCSTTPTVSVFGNTGKLTRRLYVPCSAGARVATETIEVSGGGHIPDGSDGLDIAAQSWSFFQTYG